MQNSSTAQATSIANKNNGDDSGGVGGSLYGAVKLKTTGVDCTLTAPKRYDSNDGIVQNSNNTGVPEFAKCGLKKVERVEQKKNQHDDPQKKEEAYVAIKLKKTGVDTKAAIEPKHTNKTLEEKSSFDTNNFDSVKLKRSVSEHTSSNQKSNNNEPAFDVGGLKSTGRVSRTKSHLDEPRPNDPSLWLSSVLAKIGGENKEDHKELMEKAEAQRKRIQDAGGLPVQRRLSISDNDLVAVMTKVAGNDPSVSEVFIDGDVRMHHIKPEILTGLAEGVHTNLHLKSLVIRNCDLGNDFLSTLADSVRTNFMLEHVDLSHNGFTNDSLVDFCLSMPENEALRTVILTHQHSPIFTLREDLAVEALQQNTTVQDFRVEFQTADCGAAVQKVVERNQKAPGEIKDYGQKLLVYLEHEAIIAEKRLAERKEEVKQRDVQESDMPFLYELSERAHKYKLPYEKTASDLDDKSSHTAVEQPTKVAKVSLAKLNSNLLSADGAFLTEEFIMEHLHKSETDGSLTFDFNNQIKVFKRFSITDPARATIVNKFVDALVDHPDAKDITHIMMVNSLIANDFVKRLSERCLEDSSLLPNLHFLNLETNFIDGPGVTAIAKCIAQPDTWKYLQAVKLDNQKRLISSDAEDELARSLCVNRSVIKLSLRVRNLFERRKINNYVTRNVDFLRQARHWHAVKTGTLRERARNKVEVLFDDIAANESEITKVELIADQIFLTLHPDEVINAARSFSKNTHVKTIKMSGLRLDDQFANELAKSIVGNSTIEIIDLETNMIGSEGVMALVNCLSTNSSIMELQLRHQSKPVSSTDEEKIAELLSDNTVIVKLGLDLRSTIARHSLDRKLRQNQELKRKKAPKKTGSKGIRNRIQKMFDDIAANDPKITEVSVVCDQVFLSMNPVEILKTAQSFSTNSNVKKIKMSCLRLDDEWAEAFAKSMESNKSIEKVDLESNFIGSGGMIAIVGSLVKNSTITDLLLRHQSKAMGSAEEERVPGLIDENQTIVKLSMDVRSVGAKSSIDKKLRQNQELRRKNRRKG